MKLIAKIYLLFFIVNALIYVPFILDPVLIPRFGLLVVFLILISGLLLSKPSLPPFKISLVGILILAFPFCYLINLDKALYPGEAIYFFAKEMMLSLFFLITAYFLKNNLLKKKELARSVFVFALLLSAIAIGQILVHVWRGEFSIDNMIFLRSTAANKNLLSMVLFFGICAGLLMYFEEKKPAYIFASGLFVLLIVILQTRSVWFAGLVLLACLAPWKVLRRSESLFVLKRKKWPGIVILVAISLSVIFVGYFSYSSISSAHTLNVRISLWQSTIKMIADHFFSGVGGGNWQIHFPEYGLQNFDKIIADGYLTYQRPHNDFLWVFAETGLIGFMVFISIFLISLRPLFSFFNLTTADNQSLAARTVTGCVMGYMIISFFDFPFERMEHREIMYIFLALSTTYQKEHGIISRKYNVHKNYLYILLPFLLFCVGICFQKLKGEYHLKKMIEYKVQSKWDEVILESANSKNYFFELDPFSIPVTWYAGVAYFNLNDNNAAKENFEDAYRFHPFNIHVLNNLAGCYEKESDHLNAIHYYTEALRISPAFEESLLNLSASYFNAGQFENAYASIQKISPACVHPNYAVFKNAIENKIKQLHPEVNH
jgi:O-antigen ligase